MLKVYSINHYYQLNDSDEWILIPNSHSMTLENRDNLPDEELIIDTWSWQTLIDYLKKHYNIGELHYNETAFRKTPYFCYFYWKKHNKLKEKRFFSKSFTTLS